MKEAENKKEALTEQDVKNVRSAVEKAAKAKANANPKDIEKFKELLSQSKMPVEFKDEDFKLGEGELDVRGLSDANYRQLMFRINVIKANHLRDISQSMTDIERLLMLVLKAQGVEDIGKALGDLFEELSKKVKESIS